MHKPDLGPNIDDIDTMHVVLVPHTDHKGITKFTVAARKSIADLVADFIDIDKNRHLVLRPHPIFRDKICRNVRVHIIPRCCAPSPTRWTLAARYNATRYPLQQRNAFAAQGFC